MALLEQDGQGYQGFSDDLQGFGAVGAPLEQVRRS
jgi:hypothetical protein